MLELISVDGETYRRATGVRRQCWVCMAREAVRIFELLRRDCVRGPDKKTKNENTSTKPAKSVHSLSKCFIRESCGDWCHKGTRGWLSSFRSGWALQCSCATQPLDPTRSTCKSGSAS